MQPCDVFSFSDLLRCESLHTLYDAIATRILQRNYWLVCVCTCMPVPVPVCMSAVVEEATES